MGYVPSLSSSSGWVLRGVQTITHVQGTLTGLSLTRYIDRRKPNLWILTGLGHEIGAELLSINIKVLQKQTFNCRRNLLLETYVDRMHNSRMWLMLSEAMAVSPQYVDSGCCAKAHDTHAAHAASQNTSSMAVSMHQYFFITGRVSWRVLCAVSMMMTLSVEELMCTEQAWHASR